MRIDNHTMRIAVNLTFSPELLAAARARGLNLSRVLEQRLVELKGVPPRDPFAEENAEAIAAYNARIRADGSFSDDLRAF